MITCERCGTENLEGSRYCDACGAALWLAGRPSEGSSSLSRKNGYSAQGNGSDGRSPQDASVTMAHSSGKVGPAIVTEQQTSAPLVSNPGKPHAMLIIERGSSAGKQFLLSEQDANIGRWDADGGVFPDVDLDADDPEAKVSRRHARISLRDGNYAIEDVGSTNGTFVNRGHRLVPGHRHPLKDGDEIIVGKTFLRFRVTK
jgi:FHA domain